MKTLICTLFDGLVAGLPMIPIMSPSFIFPRSYPFEAQLVFKYIAPSNIGNIYMFGFIEHIARDLIRSESRLVDDPIKLEKQIHEEASRLAKLEHSKKTE